MHEGENLLFFCLKCGEASCTTCLPIRLPRDIFDRLYHLPDPMPSPTNEGHHTNKFKRDISELQFVCGTTVSELVGTDQFKDLFTQPTFSAEILSKSFTIAFGYVACCTHCGSRGNLSNAKNEYPMCDACKKNKSNKPLARRQAFTKSTSKK